MYGGHLKHCTSNHSKTLRKYDSMFVSLIFLRDRYYSECEDKLYFIALGISYLYIKISKEETQHI